MHGSRRTVTGQTDLGAYDVNLNLRKALDHEKNKRASGKEEQARHALDLSMEVRDRVEWGRGEAAERAEPLAEGRRGDGARHGRERLVHFHLVRSVVARMRGLRVSRMRPAWDFGAGKAPREKAQSSECRQALCQETRRRKRQGAEKDGGMDSGRGRRRKGKDQGEAGRGTGSLR